LVDNATRGDRQAVLALRQYLQGHPEIWQEAGDLAKLAAEQQLHLISNDDVLLRESLLLQLDAFKQQLIEPPGSPPETILIDRIAVCWLQANLADVVLGQNAQAGKGQWEFLQKRAERAQKNLLAAVKELCMVRKLVREARARPMRQPRVSTKAAAGQTEPVADQPTACHASSQADTAAEIPAHSTLPNAQEPGHNPP